MSKLNKNIIFFIILLTWFSDHETKLLQNTLNMKCKTNISNYWGSTARCIQLIYISYILYNITTYLVYIVSYLYYNPKQPP